MSPAPTSGPASGTRVRPANPLEAMLADIWSDLLARRPVPVGDTFRALGGTPALATRMFERVERACGLPVPIAARSADLTVAALALAIRTEAAKAGRSARPGLIVRNISEAGQTARPDLFFLHGDFNGGGLYCLALASLVGKDQPFYGLAPHGLDGEPILPSIGAMALDRLDTLRALRPHGPYRLAGHCNGALVAFEMARRLESGGARVERLLLVSPTLPGAGRSRLSRARARIGALGRHYLWWRPARRRASPAPAADGASGAAFQARLTATHRRIMSAYVPGAYHRPLTILWPADEPSAARDASARLWRRAAPLVEERTVPGGHLTSITTHVAALAAAIRDCLGDEPSR
jgi:thioesterase domain-containing protein